MDPLAIRKDFPILERTVHGGVPLAYLDNAATSHKPRQVVDALVDYYTRYNANIHRGIHVLSEEATAAYEEARAKIARFIGAPTPHAIVFTRNTTEAINLVARSWARQRLGPGDEVLVSEIEHHSNLVPWQMVAQETGARLTFIPVDLSQGVLDLTRLPSLLTPRTKLVAVTMMSNVLGTIVPVGTIIQAAHARSVPVLIDGAQSVPHLPTNVIGLDCDFLAFSAHKMLGPTGVGVLYGKPELLETMEPFLGGGDMIREVWPDRATWNDVPWKFEAGTPNIADVIAFGAAVDYLAKLGMPNVQSHEQQLAAHALRSLNQLEDVTIYGPRDPKLRGGVVSFNVGDLHPHDLGQLLDAEGVAVRAGHHCCQPLMRKLGVPGTVRASFYVYNHAAEIERLTKALAKAREVLGGKRVSHQ